MASSNTKPSYIPTPFASQGQKNTIPVADQGNYLASWSLGFPPVTSEPLSEGGLPPTRLDVNGALNVLSAFVYYLQLGGFFTFDPDLSSYIGGYPNGMMLWHNDGTNVYPLVSTKNNNTDNFISNPSYIGTSWVRPLPSLGLNNAWTGSNTFNSTVSLNGNLSVGTSAKQTIVGLCVPNYSARETISSPYTPTKNGIIIAHGASGYSNAWISTNDDFVITMAQCQDSKYGQQTVWAIVKSGETYKFGSSGGSQYYFVPFVGA